ncbi:MAG TPA: peptidylprolyl isomerase [Planctomycetota bacterium]|nr:peptidylprolyl isomerase [Planctomycetota bacterium]
MRRSFALLILSFCSAALDAGEDTFNAPAIKINTTTVSIREVEALFSDSMTLIRDKLRRGELTQRDLEPAIKTAWNEAIDTATQDKIMDLRADKRRKEIMSYYLSRAGQNLSGERAMEAFRRLEGDYVRQLRRELITAAGGEEELRAALKRRGQTMQEWEAGLTRELFRRDILAMELGPVHVSPSYVKNYFEKHPEFFRSAEAWRLRRIRIAKGKFSSPKVALEAAQLVTQKAREGTEFADLAAKVSEDGEFAKLGGLLMRDGKTDLPGGNFPEEETIAEKLKDGEVSDPVDAGDYYLIVQRVGYRAAEIQTFEKASERAEALAYAEKLRSKKRELFEKLKNETLVEVLQKTPPPELMKRVRAEFDKGKGEFVAPEK